ncbi:MAG: hypothetical protein M1816_000940 [Peltula sp. TS41687]|nr:MAG: hypothetical protein M1816_000940 [Peltula sp. TS41687]
MTLGRPSSLQTGFPDESRPTVAELHGDNHFVQVARENWLDTISKRPAKLRQDVLKTDLWEPLEKELFRYRSMLILENLQILESYLWPGYTEDSSNIHVLLIVLITNVKSQEKLETWGNFTGRPSDFSSLFRRVLSMALDHSLSSTIRRHLLFFMTSAFQSLDQDIVRKECAPLVSIAIWHNLSTDRARESKLESNAHLKKTWRAAAKRYEAADEATKAKLRFDRSWLYSMMIDFLDRLYRPNGGAADDVLYCERFMELLTDLESQLPTRRYVNSLIHDLNLLQAIRLSPIFGGDKNELVRDLYGLLRHYAYFPVDDHTGLQLSRNESYEAHCKTLARLQRVGLKHFKDKLTILALSNYASIDKRDDLESHLTALTDDEMVELCTLLGHRVDYPASSNLVRDRVFFTELIISRHERRNNFRDVGKELSLCPTEETLFEPTLLRNETYDGSRPLAIPKLNLQYLTVGDFLWRSFILYRCEAFFEIRKDIESNIARLRPQGSQSGGGRRPEGFSRMALSISKPAIMEVAPSKVGHDEPAFVRAEITLDYTRLSENIRKEWDTLRPDDVVFLLALSRNGSTPRHTIGNHSSTSTSALGLDHLRTAEIVQIYDENGRPLRDFQPAETNGHGYSRPGRSRKLIVHLDPTMYKRDAERVTKDRPDIYETINFIIRRKGRENNFKPVLNTIRSLILSDVAIPSWLQEVFLGYGDPAAASYSRLPNRLQTLNFRDTFLDWQHAKESFPDVSIEESQDGDAGPDQFYTLEWAQEESASNSEPPPKKRRREDTKTVQPKREIIKASSSKQGIIGPYPTDKPRRNQVRFTPKQMEAIASGTQPGLTVIVGPPGTGKTDVATQIINNIYHNFPNQRTLLIAHSNQALNQLFQKIIALDVDERHLLRLGHGEEDLETDGSYSKYGRVESFLQNRTRYLHEVDRLAENFHAPGAHGNSCETADYFNIVYVKPAWNKYSEVLQSATASASEIIDAFPFFSYFSDAPQPLFPAEGSREEVTEIALGCYRHIKKIFSELEDIRPFEILRSPKDKANYLLVKEARIIAMTSTHAAIRRQEIANLGFHYDNVVMEEAAQITEIENFIPLAMQNPKDGKLPLQRVVLCGDHLQNSPIIQNLAFRQYANLEQSLFLRLVRLGVPTVNLDQQGRARPSIARLYKWRYPHLTDLPLIHALPEFQLGNAGFKHEYQFINVPDYKGRGESEPTPHFIQNLGEAEYAVALYQYMRLLGYPARSITILTPYAGQRALIRDVLSHRCTRNPLFGAPRAVATVDKYQGEQNNYIILSLVRTSRVGYLRDIRRMTVALSRARLGLYILGRREVFESCYELRQAFEVLLAPSEGKGDKLALVTGEMYPTMRKAEDEVEQGSTANMEGVEHLGQYVYEMTTAKVQALAGQSGPAGMAVGTEMTMAQPKMEEGGFVDDEEDDEREGLEEEVDVNADVDDAG